MRARVVARDRKRDLALLKVNYRTPHWVMPEPDTNVDILDEVYVIGFPYGDLLTFNENGGIAFEGYPEPSLNLGRVTSLRRDKDNNIAAVQTDAAINPARGCH